MPRFLFVLLLSSAACAQVTIEGDTVQKSTGKPLALVRVAASCAQSSFRTASDAAGHFRIAGLTGLRCTLYFDAAGFLPRQQSFTLGPQDTSISARIPMTPQAVIAGTITGENGLPLDRAVVMAAQYVNVNGAQQLQQVARAQADDLGRYRIGKLPPGRYYVLVRPLPDMWKDYPATWYPNGALDSGAGGIDLREGQEAKADFHLSPGGVEVRGRVIPPAGFSPSQMFLKVEWTQLETSDSGDFIPVAPDGTFALHHAAPREYFLTAMSSNLANDPNPPKYLAFRSVQVGRENIGDIVLRMVPTPVRELKGTMVSKTPVSFGQLHFDLHRLNLNAPFSAKASADGSFVIPGVWPGAYYVSGGYADGGPIESIQVGGKEIPRGQYFDFDGGDLPIQLTVLAESQMALVSGTVVDSANRPVAGAAIVLAPAGGSYTLGPPPPQTDQKGAFTAMRLTAGVYRVYVIEDPADTDLLMNDAAFRKQQESAYPPVTLAPGKNPPLKLTLPK